MKDFLGGIMGGVIIIAIALLFVIWLSSDPGDHKYVIQYSSGNATLYDYTDSITHFNDHIQYIDHKGVLVQKYGSYTIKRKK